MANLLTPPSRILYTFMPQQHYMPMLHNLLVVQFTMSRIIVSFKFLGDLQNYTFLESSEPTEPEK